MKTLISTSAIAFAAIVSASSAFACTNCNVALTATTPSVINRLCEFTTASMTGTYGFTAATTTGTLNRFITTGSAAQRGAIGIKTRGNTAVTMTIDPALYGSTGTSTISGVSLKANYNPDSGEGLTSEVTNGFGGSTTFSNTGGTNGTFGIATGTRTGTDIVTFKVGGIAVLESTTNGVDPVDLLNSNTTYTIKHVATCIQ